MIFVRVAKWISRPTSNREIAGSIPAVDFQGKFFQGWGVCMSNKKN